MNLFSLLHVFPRLDEVFAKTVQILLVLFKMELFQRVDTGLIKMRIEEENSIQARGFTIAERVKGKKNNLISL